MDTIHYTVCRARGGRWRASRTVSIGGRTVAVVRLGRFDDPAAAAAACEADHGATRLLAAAMGVTARIVRPVAGGPSGMGVGRG